MKNLNVEIIVPVDWSDEKIENFLKRTQVYDYPLASWKCTGPDYSSKGLRIAAVYSTMDE